MIGKKKKKIVTLIGKQMNREKMIEKNRGQKYKLIIKEKEKQTFIDKRKNEKK